MLNVLRRASSAVATVASNFTDTGFCWFVISAALLASSFWVFRLPAVVRAFNVWRWAPPTISTIAFIAGLGVLCVAWRTSGEQTAWHRRRWGYAAAALVVAGMAWATGGMVSAWISRLVLFAIDANRADMLVQIQLAVERFTAGKDPYYVYYVPWELPLSYGPWLWMWYLIPHALGADLRLVTVFGQIFIPLLLAVAAAVHVRAGRFPHAAVFGLLAWLVLHNPLIDDFLVHGHTPAYWPLIAVFALTCAGRQYRVAAVVLGALVGARTTLLALVPVFFIDMWRNDRKAVVPSALLVVATVAVSFGPFLVWDARTLAYGMYGNYVRVIHDYVWAHTNAMDSTLGLTRPLLVAGLGSYVGLSQVAVMLLVYVLSWWGLRPQKSAAPWLCLALTAFCMTTLWPVWYIFLDVFVLGLAYLAADQTMEMRRMPWKAIGATSALAITVLFATLLVNPGVYYTIEPGRTARWYLRSGFGPDEREGHRGFAWATRNVVHLRLPRGLRTDASLLIECEPFLADGGPVQTVAANLNGTGVGTVALRAGWQEVTFRTSGRAWRIGHNDVTLFFKYAMPSPSGDLRAIRVGRIAIVPPR